MQRRIASWCIRSPSQKCFFHGFAVSSSGGCRLTVTHAYYKARRLPAVPFACSEAPRLTVILVAYSRHVSSRGSPPAKRMGLASVAGPSSFGEPLYGDLRPTRRSCRELFSPQRDSHSSRRRCYEARDSVSPQQLHSSWALSQDPYQGLFRSLLAGSSHHDSRRYLRFVEKELTSSESYASG